MNRVSVKRRSRTKLRHNSTFAQKDSAERVVPRDSAAKKQLARKALPKTNAARRRKEWARAYGSKERVAFVKSLPCATCHATEGIENAHIRTGGKGRKADYVAIVPLCRSNSYGEGCHNYLHRVGRASFEWAWGIDLDAAAAATEKAWVEFQGRTEA